jgi:hypothetical protein
MRPCLVREALKPTQASTLAFMVRVAVEADVHLVIYSNL